MMLTRSAAVVPSLGKFVLNFIKQIDEKNCVSDNELL